MFPVRKKCAMVFQHSTLFDSMTCVENVALPLRKHRGLSVADALAEARRRLDAVHMARVRGPLPGGARRRDAQARRHRPRADARPEVRPLRRAHDVARPGERSPRRRAHSRALARARRHVRRRQPRPREHLRDRRPHRRCSTADRSACSARRPSSARSEDGVVQQFIHGTRGGPDGALTGCPVLQLHDPMRRSAGAARATAAGSRRPSRGWRWRTRERRSRPRPPRRSPRWCSSSCSCRDSSRPGWTSDTRS